MQSDEVRSKFLKFFEQKSHGGHKVVPSSSLVPQNDPSVLFTTAGMQQFKPYYTGQKDAEKDFGTKNVVTVQKCVRTSDIDEVGDDTHLTFLEMLGNFSFGGYSRREAIFYAHDFITKELGLKISYVTVYKGEGVVPEDHESKDIWNELGVKDIRLDGSDVFWGPTGDSGPCGPTTEIYCKDGAGDDVEIWNIVFNEYFCNGSREKLDKGEESLKKLDTLGIDTGMGLERLLAIVQKKKSVYETDLLEPVVAKVVAKVLNSGIYNNTKAVRVISDHIRTVMFMLADGVLPESDEKGYVPRRLIRLAMTADYLFVGTSLDKNFFLEPAKAVINIYKNHYPYLYERKEEILQLFKSEVEKFSVILTDTVRDLDKIYNRYGGKNKKTNELDGKILFKIRETHGVGFEIMRMILEEKGFHVSQKTYQKYDQEFKRNQELSRTASAGMFKGGLANTNEKTVKLHTAHHLLLAGLQALLGKSVKQRGSNITEERLRLDFLFDRKLTDEEKKKVEDFVNDKIKQGLNVVRREMPLAEAEKIGAEMEFGAKYPDVVSVYFIGPSDGNQDDAVSIEFCGGPHVKNTSELGRFKILKEEAVSAGIRRIKAALL